MRGVKFVIPICVPAFWLLAPGVGFAWSGAGHMVIAAEAWRELPRAVKTKVTAVLQSHPDYEKWKPSFAGEARGLDLPEFIFVRASTWPDEIHRRQKQYDHPHWHYIDYPLRGPSFSMEPESAPKDDILFGIEQSDKLLGDNNAPAEERAVYLSWLMHLIGDLHQPLHCASLFNYVYPNGDKGGNNFYVKPGSRGIKLHSFWDGLLGTSAKANSQHGYAIEIQRQFPRKSLKELRKATTPRDWSLEGRNIAIEKVYLRGRLKGSADEESAPTLPPDYTKIAKAVGERQSALAGYRLADEVSRNLK